MAQKTTEGEANELMEKYGEQMKKLEDVQTVAKFIGFVIRQLEEKKKVSIKIVYLSPNGWLMKIGDKIEPKFSLSDNFYGVDIEKVYDLVRSIAEHAGVYLSNRNLSGFHMITCEAYILND